MADNVFMFKIGLTQVKEYFLKTKILPKHIFKLAEISEHLPFNKILEL